ncbi:hypothetical protein UCD39_09895 [Nitrospirillum sp. BR 11752]|uniref:hypothetical protein n=1 Tax=Nitrospirillum sp. BR 11752 TaxID=3104293 RepID=UPI002EB21B86|nr:hypothetical protein [Nitrospirillum sp. BR 11752]
MSARKNATTELVNLPHAWRIRGKEMCPGLPGWAAQWHFARQLAFLERPVNQTDIAATGCFSAYLIPVTF